MPIANTVEATIVVNFEDRFTGPSQKAFEQFRRHAQSVFRAVCATGIAAFEKLKAVQQEALKFNNSPGTPDVSLWRDTLNTIGSVLSIASFAGITLVVLKNKMVTLFNLVRESNSKVWNPLLQALKNLRLVLPFIAAGFLALAPLLAPAAILFAKVAAAAGLLFLAWKAFEGIKKLLLEVKLKDEASARAGLLRKQLESTFRDPIVQEVQVLRKNLGGLAGPISNPLGLNLEPQFGQSSRLSLKLQPDLFPSFASGIRFVPRDMLAQIHKGETVLPKPQAEQFRAGRMAGISVGNITLNMNGGSGANRQEARRFARMIREELQRIDERMTS